MFCSSLHHKPFSSPLTYNAICSLATAIGMWVDAVSLEEGSDGWGGQSWERTTALTLTQLPQCWKVESWPGRHPPFQSKTLNCKTNNHSVSQHLYPCKNKYLDYIQKRWIRYLLTTKQSAVQVIFCTQQQKCKWKTYQKTYSKREHAYLHIHT